MSGKLRILFISREYPPETGWGGIGSYVASIGPALAGRGHEVHVLSCVVGQERNDYVDQGVYIHRRGQMQIRGLWRVSEILNCSKLMAWVRTGLSTFFEYRRLGVDFDVIEYPDIGAEGWVFALRHTKPLVAHLHVPLHLIYPWYHEAPANYGIHYASALEHFAVHHADVITSPSRLLVRTLKESGWLRQQTPEVIPHAIDWHHWCHTQPIQDSRPTVLFLARMTRIKAPELLVEAMSIIRKKMPEAKALFLGTSAGRRDGLAYLEWVKKSAAGVGGCEFVGYVPRHEIAPFISQSRVMAMPSWFENYPMASLEAMSAGRPVVVTSTTGVAELVEKVGAGRVIPPGNPQALAEALLPFLMDITYAAEAGERARMAVREWLDPDKIAAQREMVYQQAIVAFKQRERQKLGEMPFMQNWKSRLARVAPAKIF